MQNRPSTPPAAPRHPQEPAPELVPEESGVGEEDPGASIDQFTDIMDEQQGQGATPEGRGQAGRQA